MTTVAAHLKEALDLLKHSDTAKLDAEILLAHVLQKTRTWLYTWPDFIMNDAQISAFQTLIHKRLAGVPVAYLTGTKEFWSITLKVTEATLIPRPETELLVEQTLALLKDKPQAHILDAGTGSGAVALALAKERPDWNITACDKSISALEIAKENAKIQGFTNIHFYHSDWFSAIPAQKKYHAIVSNPPYIDPVDPHLHQGDLRFEPKEALASDEQGYEDIRFLIENAPKFLHNGGLLVLEHGFAQREKIQSILYRSGYQGIFCWQDHQGLDRISKGIWYS